MKRRRRRVVADNPLYVRVERHLQTHTHTHTHTLAAGGAIRIAHYDVVDDVITPKLQQIEKNGDHLAP